MYIYACNYVYPGYIFIKTDIKVVEYIYMYVCREIYILYLLNLNF